jgi:hypothetical protein
VTEVEVLFLIPLANVWTFVGSLTVIEPFVPPKVKLPYEPVRAFLKVCQAEVVEFEPVAKL